MASNKPDILLVGPSKPLLIKGLEPAFTVHSLIEAKDREAFLSGIADRVRAFAVTYSNQKINAKVREHSLAHVPVLLVVGRREAEQRTVALRRLGGEAQEVLPLASAG